MTFKVLYYNGDYGISNEKTMEEHWGYTHEGAMKTFINIISSYEGE